MDSHQEELGLCEVMDLMHDFGNCLVCEGPLDQEGNCIESGCTESDDYGIIEGQNWDEEDALRHSLQWEKCVHCHTKIPEGGNRCPKGCFDDIELGE